MIASLSDVPVMFAPVLSSESQRPAPIGSVTAENTTGISSEYGAASCAHGVVIAMMISSPSALNWSSIC